MQKRPFKRSSKSLQLEQLHTLVMDIETVTRLRQRCFNIWTLDDKEELKSEWQHYNEVIERMQVRLKALSGKLDKDKQ